MLKFYNPVVLVNASFIFNLEVMDPMQCESTGHLRKNNVLKSLVRKKKGFQCMKAIFFPHHNFV